MQRAVVMAGAATLAASSLFAAATWRALTTAPLEGDAPAAWTGDAPAVTRFPVNGAALALVAENDPFRPERTPAPLPYRMPGDPVELEEVPYEAPPPPPPPPPFRVMGTIAMDGGGLVVISTEELPVPRVMSVGESVQGFRLIQVNQSSAVLQRGDQVVQLAVSEASAAPVEREEPRSRRERERAEEERQGEMQRALEEQTARLRQLMQQRQGGGGGGQLPPGAVVDAATVEARLRAAEARLNAAGGRSRPVVRVRPDTLGAKMEAGR